MGQSGATVMSVSDFIFWGVLAIAVVYFILIYNNLVSLKHGVSKAWSNIDVLLKQRHDELPKLVETCRQYMKHEQETLEKVMQARNSVAAAQQQGNIPQLGQAEGALRLGLGGLFAVAEAYPDLKADETFQHLQTRISQLEDAIADRREFYNESVNNNNVRIEQFPDVIVANMFKFKAFDLLEFEAEALKDVNIRNLFDQ
jgi:LemA protein